MYLLIFTYVYFHLKNDPCWFRAPVIDPDISRDSSPLPTADSRSCLRKQKPVIGPYVSRELSAPIAGAACENKRLLFAHMYHVIYLRQ